MDIWFLYAILFTPVTEGWQSHKQLLATAQIDKHREASFSAQLEVGLLWTLEKLWQNKSVETWGLMWKSTY